MTTSSPRSFLRVVTQSGRSWLNPRPHSLGRYSTLQRSHRIEYDSRNTCSNRRCISISSRLSASSATPAVTATTTTKPTITPTPEPADLEAGLPDQSKQQGGASSNQIDWTTSFHGLSDAPFSKEAASLLLKPIDANDIEVKPDGIIYLPEIKFRRILNQAFGPGGWGLAPRGDSTVTAKAVTREYALLVHGRLVSIARGEQDYFNPDGIATAAEGCKSNALMRCCKDLGIASELWDPRFVRKFKAGYARDVWVEHVISKKKTKIWTRKGDSVPYPFKESKDFGG